MAKSKIVDRITVSFYENVELEEVLLQALNKTVPPRMRGGKLKEWAFEYLKSNKDLYAQIIKEIEEEKSGNKEFENNNQQNSSNNINKKPLGLNTVSIK